MLVTHKMNVQKLELIEFYLKFKALRCFTSYVPSWESLTGAAFLGVNAWQSFLWEVNFNR